MPPTIKESFKHTQILVKSKGDPEPFGKENERGERGKKLEFFGDANGNSHTFVCFRPALFDGIVVGQAIDADYDITETVSGDNTYVNYKVNQIYDKDGKELAQAGDSSGKRRSFGKSPEEREEISRAVALKAAVNYTMNDDVTARSPQEVIEVANVFLPFLTGGTAPPITPIVTKASGPKAPKAVAEQPDPTSPVVTADALKGLWAVAKDGNVKKEWLVAASVTLFQKADIKTITEDELSIITDKLAGEITRLNEENPF